MPLSRSLEQGRAPPARDVGRGRRRGRDVLFAHRLVGRRLELRERGAHRLVEREDRDADARHRRRAPHDVALRREPRFAEEDAVPGAEIAKQDLAAAPRDDRVLARCVGIGERQVARLRATDARTRVPPRRDAAPRRCPVPRRRAPSPRCRRRPRPSRAERARTRGRASRDRDRASAPSVRSTARARRDRRARDRPISRRAATAARSFTPPTHVPFVLPSSTIA